MRTNNPYGVPKPAPDPRDRELAVLKAQVRALAGVLISAAVDKCPPGRPDCNPFTPASGGCLDCWDKHTRQQAEKEVGL